MTTLWCARLLDEHGVHGGVRLEIDAAGRVASRADGVEAAVSDDRLGLVMPGFANAHSHVFHRALRGRTHDAGGDFWTWRERMYAVAGVLDPELYRRLATAVFSEMVANGFTAVGEFHYLHHEPSGEPYADHGMELALAAAADESGIRLVLLDTLYLDGGVGQPLSAQQRRFGDGSAERWLDRWHRLRHRLAESHPRVTLGAALHSVRAVPPAAMAEVARGLPADVPLHIHLSEQPLENDQCLAEYGMTPTELVASVGLLDRRLSVVHATHLTDSDTAALGRAQVGVVMCPTTEADLGDGIGPAMAIASAGAVVSLGSDQNAVIDPFLEMRGLEAGERLASRQRGRFSPAELLAAGTSGGYRSLGFEPRVLEIGALADLVEIDPTSLRTAGAFAQQLVMAATAVDVVAVRVGGRQVFRREGRAGASPAHVIADELRDVMATLDSRMRAADAQ